MPKAKKKTIVSEARAELNDEMYTHRKRQIKGLLVQLDALKHSVESIEEQIRKLSDG